MSEEILVARINVLQRQIDTLGNVVSNLEARLGAIASAAAHADNGPAASSVVCGRCSGCGTLRRCESILCTDCNGSGVVVKRG